MDSLIYVVTGLFVVATLTPLSKHSHWLIRGLDFPRVQLACIGALLILLQVMFFKLSSPQAWAAIALSVICLAGQLWWILPYSKFWKKEVQDSTNTDKEKQLSILTSNVLMTNKDAHKLIALAKKYQPDVLVTLESNLWWEQQLSCLEEDMPNTIKCPLDNLYGMHVYSRLPLHKKEISFLVEEDIPSMHALLELPTGDKIRVHFLHPAPPSPTENPESAERDAELVIVAKSVADSEQPVIVTGDLNDVAWSRTTRLFRQLSGLLDPRVGRGMFNTFHADFALLRWPLDHLFHSSHFTTRSIQRLPSIGSDHFPFFTRLTFNPTNKSTQSGLRADENEKAFAATVASEKNVSKTDVPNPGE
ncbi:endonuclease/exonuclease/phosphatase family protein [Paraglaciecola sp. 2405UD69-4]|uniref:endonuclease/exonuclease/phosphatase family protein n=1 Tax=Paraglaciecola sp. 2405UD69-4 TaxID=3391836 RepID=UPI0039C90F99